MNYFIPTYEQCQEICKENGDLIFYETKHIIQGYNVSTFNYRLARYNQFIKPIASDLTINATELRGITFIFNTDGTLFKYILMLNKFWNVNEVETTQLIDLIGLEIENIHNKEDGSMICFVPLPNGNIVAKTKNSFDNDQTKKAQEIFEANYDINIMVKDSIILDESLIFELVSPLNKIVLQYDETDLILLRARDNKTGEYLSTEFISSPYNHNNSIKLAIEEPLIDLVDLMLSLEHTKNKEGSVVQFKGGKLVKFKTNWYFEEHRIASTDVTREDFLISYILDEKIDDILAQVGKDNIEVIEIIDITTNIINKYLKDMVNSVESVISSYRTDFNSDIKEFCLSLPKKNRSKEVIYALSKINRNDLEIIDIVIADLKKCTYFLSDARHFLTTGGIKK